MAPFDNWTIRNAKQAIERTRGDADGIESNRKFYEGDHWQGSNGYAGPMPTGSGEAAQTATAIIEKAFVSRNAIREVITRHVNGVLGRRIPWTVTPRRPMDEEDQPTDQEDQLIQEARAMLDAWIEAREIDELWNEIGAKLLYAGESPIRLFVPADQVGDDEMIPPSDLETALHRIYVETPGALQAGIYTDRRSQRQAAIYLYTENNQDHAEIAYIDDDRRTVIRQLGADADARYSLDLGRRLPMFVANRPLLITAQIRSQQRTLNLAKTMKNRNIELAGFLERTLLNASLPGKLEKRADGSQVYTPEPMQVGAGVINSIVGIEITDADGRKRYTTPDIRYRDPVPVDTFIKTEQSAYLSILGEAHQLHYAIAGDATPSGEARIAAMADYVTDLLTTKRQIDRAYSWLLETVLAMAATFAGAPGRYAALRISADAQIDPGPITVDMMRAVNELAKDRMISYRLGRIWIGVEDPEKEERQIEEEAASDARSAAATFAPLLGNLPAINGAPSGPSAE